MNFSFVFSFLLLSLAWLFTGVDGKGGGGGGRGGGGGGKSSGSKGSSGSSKGSTSSSGIIIVPGGAGTVQHCKEEKSGRIVKCPNQKGVRIAGIVVGSIFGALLLGYLIWAIVVWWKRNRRHHADKTTTVPAGGRKYKRLDDKSDDVSATV